MITIKCNENITVNIPLDGGTLHFTRAMPLSNSIQLSLSKTV